MSNKKVIAVAGATGAQGGGAARAILAEPESGFTVHALTRDPGSPAARELAALGVEVVRGGLR
ncbi:NmrA family NAD(P)-binding protein [Streptomyces sp. NPDC047461]|uniref:NmrA family NAD(P)-binding protein n=1 Tax=Streptomyces sp. NPDC047461 TaxID=3155619 RepID=UPI0033DED17F